MARPKGRNTSWISALLVVCAVLLAANLWRLSQPEHPDARLVGMAVRATLYAMPSPTPVRVEVTRIVEVAAGTPLPAAANAVPAGAAPAGAGTAVGTATVTPTVTGEGVQPTGNIPTARLAAEAAPDVEDVPVYAAGGGAMPLPRSEPGVAGEPQAMAKAAPRVLALAAGGLGAAEAAPGPGGPVAATQAESPLDAPTAAPTEVPTEVATDIPTEVPTEPPTDAPTEAPTAAPADMPPVDAAGCPQSSGNSYTTIPVAGGGINHPDSQHGDLNMALRGYAPTDAPLGLIDKDGPVDGDPPQLAGIFADHRRPTFVQAYRVNDWNWSCGEHGCRGGPLDHVPATLMQVQAAAGEALSIPQRGAQIYGGGYKALVLYAEATRITLGYTRVDTVADGYVVHLENICVDPNLVALYQGSNAAGRGSLPALREGEVLGTASGPVGVAVRDRGTFWDPRSRLDWWKGY